MDADITKYAAENGNLEALKIAFQSGCPWHPKTTIYASENGFLDCLKYAIENGCPWHEDTTLNAINNGRLNCLKYAIENDDPYIDQLDFSECKASIFKDVLNEEWCMEFLYRSDLSSNKKLQKLINNKKNKLNY